ncbi:MAG: D-alanine--D-alanine ligase [Alphaproteobacteria bacterium]
MAKRVVVLKGGISAEREVSLTSGAECAAALREAGFDVGELDVSRDMAALLAALTPPPDVVFNALHGRYGEDGRIQALLDLMRIPYTHSGVLASALAMDKVAARRVFAAAGLRVAEGKVVPTCELSRGDPFSRPYVIKPVNEGSSVGVRIMQPGDNAPYQSIGDIGHVLVERYVAGRELTVAVMGEEALAVTELKPTTGFYDYEAKYTEGRAVHVCPAELPAEVYREAMRMALAAHRLLGCRGVSRADLRYDDTSGHDPSKLYLLEVNTQPGMTPLSLVPEQAAYRKISFTALVTWMVEHAGCD